MEMHEIGIGGADYLKILATLTNRKSVLTVVVVVVVSANVGVAKIKKVTASVTKYSIVLLSSSLFKRTPLNYSQSIHLILTQSLRTQHYDLSHDPKLNLNLSR